MKRRNILISGVIIPACFLACPFLLNAATTGATPAQNQYYLISLVYDSATNKLALDSNQPISLTSNNLVKDSGSGSKFYATAVSAQSKYLLFSNNSYKFYLGNWQTQNSQTNSGIKVTVPYSPAAITVRIFDAKKNRMALKVDVSKFTKKANAAAAPKTSAAAASAAKPTSPQVYQIVSHSAAYWWMMRGIVLLILGGAGYFIYRWRKKKKAALNLSQSTISLTRK